MSDDSAVLDYCNEVRKELRRGPVKEIRKGIRVDISQCPVAATINHGCRNLVEVDGIEVTITDENDEEVTVSRCPLYIRAFILAFDNGNLPQYEGEGWA